MKTVRMDVTKLLIFMDQLRLLSRNISVCMDGDWHNILVVEDVPVRIEDEKSVKSVSEFSSEEYEEGNGSSELASLGEEEVERDSDERGNMMFGEGDDGCGLPRCVREAGKNTMDIGKGMKEFVEGGL